MRLFFAFIFCSSLIVNFSSQNDNKCNSVRMNRWLDYYGISVESFTDTLMNENQSFYVIDYNPVDKSLEIYDAFFIYSPDSSYYIDLDSYSLMLEKNQNGELFTNGTEIDMQVALVSFKENTKLTIIFCGTACLPEEAEWLDNENVNIFGFSEIGETMVPTFWTFNLTERKLIQIKANSSVEKEPFSYLKQIRLDKIKFNF